ncbi:trans-aconitate 2-methyltransferase [Kineococcus aurantiacus]|uniref:Trans-aconitate 2-methyltransferase n=1 Tax=Kineococcus aurantiacus TaxID=37633 RepID=A0A7Y9DJ08_9ACTN|nr:trans-aconitate 2-methyltransferase [Kineococcus aurantiacus]
MTSPTWDPAQYARFASPRARPFHDLLARVGAQDPAVVVDVGCGPGTLTLDLARRWPRATVRGLDSSPEMVAQAPAGRGVEFSVAAAEEFDARGVDVVVCNAVLQWVPTHRELLRRWASQLAPGAWLAFQVPSNFDAPSHRLMRELAASPPWRHRLAGVLRGTESVASPAQYLDLLAGQGLVADVWQTEYLHVLPGQDPVLEWVRGTGLRPVLQALDPGSAAEFEREYAALLREAYPARDYGTPLPFLRTFAVSTVPA